MGADLMRLFVILNHILRGKWPRDVSTVDWLVNCSISRDATSFNNFSNVDRMIGEVTKKSGRDQANQWSDHESCAHRHSLPGRI
jgi:hypothetical protein